MHTHEQEIIDLLNKEAYLHRDLVDTKIEINNKLIAAGEKDLQVSEDDPIDAVLDALHESVAADKKRLEANQVQGMAQILESQTVRSDAFREEVDALDEVDVADYDYPVVLKYTRDTNGDGPFYILATSPVSAVTVNHWAIPRGEVWAPAEGVGSWGHKIWLPTEDTVDVEGLLPN